MDEMKGGGKPKAAPDEAALRQDDGPAAEASREAVQGRRTVHADDVFEAVHPDELSDDSDFEEEELNPGTVDHYYEELGLNMPRDWPLRRANIFLSQGGRDKRYLEAALSRYRALHLKRGLEGGLRHLREAFLRLGIVRHFTGYGTNDYYSPSEIYRQLAGQVSSYKPNYASLAGDLLLEKTGKGGKKLEPGAKKFEIMNHFRQPEVALDDVSRHLFRQLDVEDVKALIIDSNEFVYSNIALALGDDAQLADLIKSIGVEKIIEFQTYTRMRDTGTEIAHSSLAQIENNLARTLSIVESMGDPAVMAKAIEHLSVHLPALFKDNLPDELKSWPNKVLSTIVSWYVEHGEDARLFALLTNQEVSPFTTEEESIAEVLSGEKGEKGAAYTLYMTLHNLGRDEIFERLFDLDSAEEPAEQMLKVNVVRDMLEKKEDATELVRSLQTHIYGLEKRAALDDLVVAGKLREELDELDIDLESIGRATKDVDSGAVALDAAEYSIMQDQEISEKERLDRLDAYRARARGASLDDAPRASVEARPVAEAARAPARSEDLSRLDFDDVPEGRSLQWAIARVLSASHVHDEDEEALFNTLQEDLSTLLRAGEEEAAEYLALYLCPIFSDLYGRGVTPEGLLIHLYWGAVGLDAPLRLEIINMLGAQFAAVERSELMHYFYMNDSEWAAVDRSIKSRGLLDRLLKEANMSEVSPHAEAEAKKALDEKIAYFEGLIGGYHEQRRELNYKELLLERLQKSGALGEEAARGVDKLKGEILDERKALAVLDRAREEAMAEGSPHAWQAKIDGLKADFVRNNSEEESKKRIEAWKRRGGRQ